MFKKIIFVLFCNLVFSNFSTAQDTPVELSITGHLANAKFVGLCGTFRQMALFQESTKIEGGDSFMSRFLYAETARLGQTPMEFAQQCDQSINAYNTFIATISEAEGLPNPNQ